MTTEQLPPPQNIQSVDFQKDDDIKDPFKEKVTALVLKIFQHKDTTEEFQIKLFSLIKKDSTVNTFSNFREIALQAMTVFTTLKSNTFEVIHTREFSTSTKNVEQFLNRHRRSSTEEFSKETTHAFIIKHMIESMPHLLFEAEFDLKIFCTKLLESPEMPKGPFSTKRKKLKAYLKSIQNSTASREVQSTIATAFTYFLETSPQKVFESITKKEKLFSLAKICLEEGIKFPIHKFTEQLITCNDFLEEDDLLQEGEETIG